MKKKDTNIRQFEGVFIPKSILDSRELSPMLKFLLIEIKCLDNDFGCTACNAHLAERIASSSNSVSNMISELAKKSFVYVSYKDEKACSGRVININQIKYYGIDPKLPQNNPTLKVEGGTPKVEGHTLKVEGGTPKVEHRKELEKKEEEKENEGAHAQTFELQDEKEKAAEPQAAQPYLNANAQKTYKSHLEIYNTLVAFWKANPEYTETINLMIEPLGMGSQFPNKRKAFFDHVENIFCTSIKKNHKTPLSAFELHDMIVQKIAYAKAELSELKPIGGKEEAKEKKMAEIKNKPFISEEEESIIVAYCQDRTGYSYTTSKEFRECQDIKAQRMYLQAKSNIENTKKYLINKNLIAA